MTGFDPSKLGSRSGPAWVAGLAVLDDGEWHRWTDVVTAMLEASDVLPKTASNLLHSGVGAALFQRTGHHPTRLVKLLEPHADGQPMGCG